ncbi:MAG: response regulator [Bacteroidota bacterium]
MTEPAKNPITLRFQDEALEQAFWADYVEKSRRSIEIGLVAGLIVYGVIFGIMDWVQATNALWQIWVLRGTVCLIGIGALIYNRTAVYPQNLHGIVSVIIFVAGLGLIAMILLDHSPDAYLDGPVLLILPAYVLFRLRFIHASIIGVILFLLYCVAIYFVEGMRATDLLASAIFLFAANLIGMFAGYALEAYARQAYWQTRVIDEERAAKASLLEVKNRFFANISHEIRTPLTLILGPVDDLIQAPATSLPAPVLQVLRAVRRSGDRLLSFINQLLDLSRAESEQLPMQLHQGDLVEFLEQVMQSFQPYAQAEHVAVTFIPETGATPFVSDFEKLEVIVSNLVSNAIKYTPSGGAVHVALIQHGAWGIELAVKDNGPGIAADALPHIFDRFYRVAEGHVRQKAGLGLGLALTRVMVEQLNGRIDVVSTVGVGTTFNVRLPKLDVAPESLPRLNLSRAAPDTAVPEEIVPAVIEGQPTVLVVDDDPEVRGYLTECLETYTIFEASNGEEAVALVTRHMPDLIVSDLMMPVMDGKALVNHLRAQPMLSHIPFIMLTADNDNAVRLESLDYGVDDFLTKPFNSRELQLRVRNMLAARQRMQLDNQAHLFMTPAREDIQSAEHVFLEKLRSAIDANLQDEHFNADALADALGVSTRQLQRKSKALTNETPTALIRIMRLKKAGHLIADKYGTIAEVAYAVGFNNPAYFTKCFREHFGVAPSNWQSEEGDGN